MASLEHYNKEVFTNVRKFDQYGTYLGVLVSGKLNQYNGQGYPIIDAIDIDWDGAFVKNLNTYLYTTEDLINCLNVSYSNFNNYVAGSYFSSYSKSVLELLNEQISYGDNYNNDKITYLYDNSQKLLDLYDYLEYRIGNLQDFAVDRTNYYKIEYGDIVENGQLKYYGDNSRRYFIFDKTAYQYVEVSDNFVILNPEEIYFMNIVDNVLQDMSELQYIYDFIGSAKYDQDYDTYTYTGLIEKLHNYDIDLENIHDELDNTTYVANNAYQLAYNSYTYIDNLSKQVIINRDNIGFHTTYNVYKPINELSQEELNRYLQDNHNSIYTYNDDGTYRITSYNSTYQGQYYVHYNKILGTGIEREIELLDEKMYDNSYILYKLNVESDNPDYLLMDINPDVPGDPSRTIKAGVINSYIDSETGSYTKGIITNMALINSFAYLFNWKIFRK